MTTTYTFTKENHLAFAKEGYNVVKEGWNQDGDVVVTYQNPATYARKSLLRPDNDSYTGIVPKWELEAAAEPAPQDIAMEDFRKAFRLVAGCHVSDDGKMMAYQMQTIPGAARWLSDAQAIITANQMPLKAGVRAVKKGEEVSVELRIVYTPK